MGLRNDLLDRVSLQHREICNALDCQPGDLLRVEPETPDTTL